MRSIVAAVSIRSKPELVRVELTWQGVVRFFHVYVPRGYRGGNGAVFVLHGGGTNRRGPAFARLTEMNTFADANGFIAVYPDSQDSEWNDGRSTIPEPEKDDIGFLGQIRTYLNARFGASTARMCLCGASNGGMLTQRIAYEQPSEFAAYATVVANLPEDVENGSPAGAAAMMMFNGVEDTRMPYAGGEIPGSVGGIVIGSEATRDVWATANGTTGSTETEMPNLAPLDGCTVFRRVYTGGTKPLWFYRIEGGGHTWPGNTDDEQPLAGNTCRDISATTIMVNFFITQGL